MNSGGLNNIKYRKIINSIFAGLLLLSTLFGILVLVILLLQIFSRGFNYLSIDFLINLPSRFPHKAGIKTALIGSMWVISLTAAIAFPVGVGTAIYLEEYAKRNWFNRLLQLNISNLAGVPSIVYGILGLTVFVRLLQFNRSILSASLTLALLILPIIIVSAQEAIKSVPDSLRQGSFALGVTKWQTITGVVLPFAIPGILTGTILAISRAMGEAAPLIMIGAAGYIAYLPTGIMDSFTTLPIQIFNWTSRPQEEFQNIAAAGILVLLLILLSINAIAIIIRNKYQNRIE